VSESVPKPGSKNTTLFVTGKLAEEALRNVLNDTKPKAGERYEVAVMPITVAALLTTPWIANRLRLTPDVRRVVLPGMCRGELSAISTLPGVVVERGPTELRALPEFLGQKAKPTEYGKFDIEIVAEINHAPSMAMDSIIARAEQYRRSGADVIDLGCNPGETWSGIGLAVRELRQNGLRVSVDSFNTREVRLALESGAELVLSVNSSNSIEAIAWVKDFPNAEVVAIPDTPDDLDSLTRTHNILADAGVRHRLDPILEPIGFGFAASLARYQLVRQQFPTAEMLMGVGNLTELTDVDSAGVNVLLAGVCQEIGIRSVLCTEVINWSRSAIKEFDLARRLVYHAVIQKVLPKRLEPNLVMLRDPKLYPHGQVELEVLASKVTDRNYRLFAERGELHIMNGSVYLRGTDPFELFAQLLKLDPKLDNSHSFYLGYEFAKAVTALTLDKQYTQDRALRWGFLTVEEVNHRNPGIVIADSPVVPSCS
jgi:dihydropteroate synthase-like protein